MENNKPYWTYFHVFSSKSNVIQMLFFSESILTCSFVKAIFMVK